MQRVGLRNTSTSSQQENAGGIRGKQAAARPVTRAALGDLANRNRAPINPAKGGEEAEIKKTGYGAQGQSRLARQPLHAANKENAERKSSSIFQKGSLLARGVVAKPITRQAAAANLRQAHKAPVPVTPEDVEMPSPAKETPEALIMAEITEDRGSAHSYSASMIPGVEDIDEGDEDDPQLAARFTVDIYKYLRMYEKKFGVKESFLVGKVVTPRMRGILVDWLHQVHTRFHLLPETIYMTVNIIDRYLEKVIVEKDQLQLVGVTGMLIAAKYEEMYAPEINDFVYITDDTYTAKQILAMELKMLSALGCNLGRPLPIHFLRRFSKAAEADYIVHTMGKYMMELALCDNVLAAALPSHVAGASLLLTLTLIQAREKGSLVAVEGVWTPTLVHYSGLREEENLRPVLHNLAKLLIKVHGEKSKIQCNYEYDESRRIILEIQSKNRRQYHVEVLTSGSERGGLSKKELEMVGSGEKTESGEKTVFALSRELRLTDYGSVPIVRGQMEWLPESVQSWVAETVRVLEPRGVWVCDGSEEQAAALRTDLLDRGNFQPLRKHPTTFLARTEPSDVARVEDKTWIVTPNRNDVEADLHPAPALAFSSKTGVATVKPKPALAQWMSETDATSAVSTRFPGAMRGRLLFVVPFCMGQVGGRASMVGVELTDSPYVVLCMGIMTRVGPRCLFGKDGTQPVPFVRCVHTIGVPLPAKNRSRTRWECNPPTTIILHWPLHHTVWSYGSGYGGNSLLGKKCLALRIAAWEARKEGWFAAHMAIFSLTRLADGVKRYIGAAFPSGCGKTNLALLQPSKPGWKVECVGDDIAWLRWNPATGRLCATCPENGFFGVAPGSNERTNPHVLTMLHANSIITNVAATVDGDWFWEGLEDLYKKEQILIKDWRGDLRPLHTTDPGAAPFAHANARFAAPLSQCPIRHPELPLDSYGVPLDAILFGSRRPNRFPLVYEASHTVMGKENQAEMRRSAACTPWLRGAFIGASLFSEPTAAAQKSVTPVSSGKRAALKPEPFAMRPFVAYNFGRLCKDWIQLGESPTLDPGVPKHLPRVYHVNWFREDEVSGELLWPGFSENIRVLEWIMKRLEEGEEGSGLASETGEMSLLGVVPKKEAFDLEGVTVNWEGLMEQTWVELGEEVAEVCAFFKEQGGSEFPVRLAVCGFQHLGVHMDPLTPLFRVGWEHLEQEALNFFEEDVSQDDDLCPSPTPTLYYLTPTSSLTDITQNDSDHMP